MPEKLKFNRLADFLEKRHLIYNKQFGFRSHHSTDHAVLSIIDQVQKAIEDRDYPCGIFLDFSKAFDTVNHNNLLSRLEFYGIRGVFKDLFTSYLRNRMQMMSLASVNSDIQTVCCGVPQGSVLVSMTFTIAQNYWIFTFLQMMQVYSLSIRTLTFLKVKLTVNLLMYIIGYLQISFHWILKSQICHFSSSAKRNSQKGYIIYHL